MKLIKLTIVPGSDIIVAKGEITKLKDEGPYRSFIMRGSRELKQVQDSLSSIVAQMEAEDGADTISLVAIRVGSISVLPRVVAPPVDRILEIRKALHRGSAILCKNGEYYEVDLTVAELWTLITAKSDKQEAADASESPSADNPFVTTSAMNAAISAAIAPYAVKMVKKTIGGVGVEGCDFNFATAEDMAEQVIDLGELLPGLSRLVDVFSHTNAAFTGAVTLAADIGITSGGNELIASGTILAADAIRSIAAGSAFVLAPSVSGRHVYLNATPGANWSLVISGMITVYIIYIDVLNME